MNEVQYDSLLDPYHLINFCDVILAPEEIKWKKFKKVSRKLKEKRK